jgi:hypothetical protein
MSDYVLLKTDKIYIVVKNKAVLFVCCMWLIYTLFSE